MMQPKSAFRSFQDLIGSDVAEVLGFEPTYQAFVRLPEQVVARRRGLILARAYLAGLQRGESVAA